MRKSEKKGPNSKSPRCPIFKFFVVTREVICQKVAPIWDPVNFFWVFSLLGHCGKFYECKKIMFCCLLSHSARKQVRCYWSVMVSTKTLLPTKFKPSVIDPLWEFLWSHGHCPIVQKRRFQSAVSRCSFSSRKHPILTDSKDWCFNWKPRFLIIRGLSVNKSICSARFRSTSADHILYNSAWIWLCMMIISVSWFT